MEAPNGKQTETAKGSKFQTNENSQGQQSAGKGKQTETANGCKGQTNGGSKKQQKAVSGDSKGQ